MKDHKLLGAFALILLVSCIVGIARAQTTCTKVADNKAHVCWMAVTTFIDGTPITGTVTYTVQQLNGSAWANVASVTALDWTSAVLNPGTYSFRVTATVAGATSAASASGDKLVPNPIPNAPASVVVAQVTVTIAAPAFRIVGRWPRVSAGDFVALVPVGRDCSGPVLFKKNGYTFRQVSILPSEAWQADGPAPRIAAAPCVREAT